MSAPAPYQWIDSRILPADEIQVPLSRGLWYGDGCFETLLVDAGKTYGFKKHLNRLKGGLDYLGFTGIEEIIAQVPDGVRNLLEANKLHDRKSRVRIQVWREGTPGFAPPDGQKPRLQIMASPVTGESKPIKLAMVPTRRIPDSSLRSEFKLSSAANYIRAAAEARDAGADEALMRTVEGFLSETTIANVFWLIGDTVYTPSSECDLLPGIMRECFIRWIKHEQISLRFVEGSFEADQIRKADEVWLTNSVRMIQPVSEIDDIRYQKAPQRFQNIHTDFRNYLNEQFSEI